MKTTRTTPVKLTDCSTASLALRARRGVDMSRCPTCCKDPEAPYRRYVDGVIVEGCIDACHTPHMSGTTNTAAWHNRPAAVALRRAEFDRYRAI